MFLMIVLSVLIVDLLIPFVIAIPYKGYSHLKTVMSVLGCKESPWGRVYNIWMIVSGCTIAAFSYILYMHYQNEHPVLAIILSLLVFIYGVCDEVISGIFPLNEKKDDVTLVTKIHGVGSVIGFVALLFAPLTLAIIQFKDGAMYSGYTSLAFFILSFVAFAFFVMGENPKFKNSVFGLEGLWQRVLCCLMYAPFIIWIVRNL